MADSRLNLSMAAALIGFTPARLLYYIRRYGQPKHEIDAGRKIILKADLLRWKKNLKDGRVNNKIKGLKRKYES